MMKIELRILNKEFYTGMEYKNIPSYATFGSAGIDLICCENLTIYPGEIIAIHTGLAIHIGSGCKDHQPEIGSVMGIIAPRSGLGTSGLILANTIGIIDEDYQGEIIIQVWNRNPINYEPHIPTGVIELKAGDRIAQLIFVPVIKAQFEVVNKFTRATERGSGSFGSTGK